MAQVLLGGLWNDGESTFLLSRDLTTAALPRGRLIGKGSLIRSLELKLKNTDTLKTDTSVKVGENKVQLLGLHVLTFVLGKKYLFLSCITGQRFWVDYD